MRPPVAIDDQGILRIAQEHLAQCNRLPYIDALKPSDLWRGHLDKVLSESLKAGSLLNIVRHQLDNNGFTYPHHNQEKEFRSICDAYIQWIEKNEQPLSSLPLELQESPLCSPSLLMEHEGRPVSTLFFWHYCSLVRVLSFMPSAPSRILEIGGGYGGLARLAWLKLPQVKYTIIDLSESLFFSYIYLAANFPGSRIAWPATTKELKKVLAEDNYDFLLITCALGNDLKGLLDVDVTINTASLGEMSQASADWYLAFIQNGMKTRYFYYINRLGHFTDGRAPERSLNCSMLLDPHWRMHCWDNEHSHSVLDPSFMRHLEFFAERIPQSLYSPQFLKVMSDQQLAIARARTRRDDAWEHHIWESVRLCPQQENVSEYLSFLSDNDYTEKDRVAALLASLQTQKAA